MEHWKPRKADSRFSFRSEIPCMYLDSCVISDIITRLQSVLIRKFCFVYFLQTLSFVALIIVADDICIWFFSLVGLDISLSVNQHFLAHRPVNYEIVPCTVTQSRSLVMYLKALLGFAFWPFAYLMGVESDDLEEVSRLLGLKVLANEFLAYILLGRYIKDGTISVRLHTCINYRYTRTLYMYNALVYYNRIAREPLQRTLCAASHRLEPLPYLSEYVR